MIEKILERWTKQINDQDVVKAFLTEIIDIWNSSCYALADYFWHGKTKTDGIQRESCTFCTRLLIEVHRFYGVPIELELVPHINHSSFDTNR